MAKRYMIPVEETADDRRALMWDSVLKSIVLEPDESLMIYFTPDQPIATLYVFSDLAQIAGWLSKDRNNRIGYIDADKGVIAGTDIAVPPPATPENTVINIPETKIDPKSE